MEISRQTARRFILGRQGLWPGRRWRGMAGTERAMRAMEHLQLDPLGIMAQAQDLMLHSRVIDYHPDDWARLTYDMRRFFDWGGWLAARPMEEMPYWRRLMRRERENGHWREVEHEHHATIVEMRKELRERGTITNRDFTMASRKRTDSYRGRKDSAVALYYLWRVGEAMVHHRERFERVYAPTEAIVPRALLEEASDAETDDFMRRKHVAFEGISALKGSYTIQEKDGRPATIASALSSSRGRRPGRADRRRLARPALGTRRGHCGAHVLGGRSRPTRLAAARHDGDGGSDVSRASRSSQRAQAREGTVRLRLHLGGLHASPEAQVRLLRAARPVGRSTGGAVRRPSRTPDLDLRDPRPVAGRARAWSRTTISSKHSHEASRGTASFSAPTSSTLRGSAIGRSVTV